MSDLATLAKAVSNWGRWGADDERGTVNFITPEVIRKGAACVRRGEVFSLGLPLGTEGPQFGQAGRTNPLHVMTAINAAFSPDPNGPRISDDMIVMGLQVATQWDSLAHVHYGGAMYNGHPPQAVTPLGASKNGIDKQANGIVSRGVLLDIARLRGVERLAPGTAITAADLEAAEQRQNVRVESGDVLLVRTGHLRAFTIEGDRVLYMKQMPGLSATCAPWLHAREVAAVATDTNMVEVYPPEDPAILFPLHMLCLRDMGLTLGEMFDLEALADDCARDHQSTFFFTAPPLRVTGGVGSPLNPLAIK